MENPKCYLKMTKKLMLLTFLRNFELLLWVSCSQIDIKVVISIKYVWNTFCLGKGHASEIFPSNCMMCQKPCQLQNFKILSTFQGQKNPHGQNFWNLIFLFIYLKRQGYIDLTKAKMNFWSQHLHT